MSRPLLDNATLLITGASAGIGRVIAELAAPRARGLILVARRLDRLTELADRLRGQHRHLRVDCLRADLADPADVTRLCAALDELPAIDVLVNNAGVGDFGVYDRAPWPRLESMMRLNVLALAQLTHHLLGGMVARGRGGVLNISSGFGLAFAPGCAGYIGTKHFVSGFTEGLRLDLEGTGVTATHVCPGPVDTEFATASGMPDSLPNLEQMLPRWLMVSDKLVAQAALEGLEAQRALVIPGLLMKTLWILAGISPRPLMRLFMAPLARWLRRRELAAAEQQKLLQKTGSI